MALHFDDDHLNASDKKKNSDNVKYNGSIERGTTNKWKTFVKQKDTYNSAGGNSPSRKQGTGELGRQATLPGEVIDTSKMSNPEEKFRYLKALGMIPGQEPEEQPKEVKKVPPKNQPYRRGR